MNIELMRARESAYQLLRYCRRHRLVEQQEFLGRFLLDLDMTAAGERNRLAATFNQTTNRFLNPVRSIDQ